MFGKKKVGFRQIAEKELQDVTNHVAEQEILSLKEQVSSKNEEISALCKELEQFYIEAIENCKTIDALNAVMKRYYESASYRKWGKENTNNTYFGLFNDSIRCLSPVEKAAETKTKEINRKWINEVCDQLDNYQIGEDEVPYADHMMELLKDIAGIEADGKAILDAWKSGLDAWRVFLSMLSVYGVKQADVLGAE